MSTRSGLRLYTRGSYQTPHKDGAKGDGKARDPGRFKNQSKGISTAADHVRAREMSSLSRREGGGDPRGTTSAGSVPPPARGEHHGGSFAVYMDHKQQKIREQFESAL